MKLITVLVLEHEGQMSVHNVLPTFETGATLHLVQVAAREGLDPQGLCERIREAIDHARQSAAKEI